MPIIRVEVPADTQKTIRIAVKAAVLKTLAPKQTKYDYVAMREVVAEIGDGVSMVEIDLRPGREPERKKALVDAIAETLNDMMGVEAADIYVEFRESPAENHYSGGTTLPPGCRRTHSLMKMLPAGLNRPQLTSRLPSASGAAGGTG